ncbi:MAG TPA: AAA family ATPase [Allosphingosinicella sp.]|jgi:hypothetical protein
MTTRYNDYIYFTRLELENVKSFGERQFLDLTTDGQKPARWTLLLGENGVGKTTVLQCLVRMRPDFENRPDTGPDEEEWGPEIAAEDDNTYFNDLMRNGPDVVARLEARMVAGFKIDGTGGRPNAIRCEATVERRSGKFYDFQSKGTRRKLCPQPVVLAYGAGRHIKLAKSEAELPGPVESLFDAAVELVDAEAILQRLDYLVAKSRERGPRRRLNSLTNMLAAILPDVDRPEDISINPPLTAGLGTGPAGVQVRTPHGQVALHQLSLGYQTVTAWTIDIAWRLFNQYPDSPHPMKEPAVVIVDEIDLHLHPQWQRHIREHLTDHFPNVQFIATAHSPLIAQDCLEENLALLRLDESEHQVEIVNEPAVVHSWRLDQVITSELYGFDSARSDLTNEFIERRLELLRKPELDEAEQRELEELEIRVASLGPGWTEDDEVARRVVERTTEILRQRRTA